ncbi:unnamed protein product [Jaminaea pallidilutea]
MPTSPTATRDNMRLYESYIAPSPKAHMAIKAPLGRLRRRTTELVDQITGATIQEEVKQQERDLREEKRKWRCRACKVSYAGERELNKHLHMFPSHVEVVEARRQGRRPRGLQHSASASAGMSLPTTPIGDVTSGKASSKGDSKRHHSRARTTSGPLWTQFDDSSVRMAGQLDQPQEAEFDYFGPFAARQQSAPGPSYGDTSPMQTRTRRGFYPGQPDEEGQEFKTWMNEERGRLSVQKVDEERRLRRVARLASEAKREEARIAREEARQEARRVAPRRGASEGLISALRKTSSSLSLSGMAAQNTGNMNGEGGGSSSRIDKGKAPAYSNIQWDSSVPSGSGSKSKGNYFDVNTGEVVSDEDDNDSVHGETAAVDHAPSMISFGSSSTATRNVRSFGDDFAPTFGHSRGPSYEDAAEEFETSAGSSARSSDSIEAEEPQSWNRRTVVKGPRDQPTAAAKAPLSDSKQTYGKSHAATSSAPQLPSLQSSAPLLVDIDFDRSSSLMPDSLRFTSSPPTSPTQPVASTATMATSPKVQAPRSRRGTRQASSSSMLPNIGRCTTSSAFANGMMSEPSTYTEDDHPAVAPPAYSFVAEGEDARFHTDVGRTAAAARELVSDDDDDDDDHWANDKKQKEELRRSAAIGLDEARQRQRQRQASEQTASPPQSPTNPFRPSGTRALDQAVSHSPSYVLRDGNPFDQQTPSMGAMGAAAGLTSPGAGPESPTTRRAPRRAPSSPAAAAAIQNASARPPLRMMRTGSDGWPIS